jgi:hypothetical protein
MAEEGPAVNERIISTKRQRQAEDRRVREIVLRTLMAERNGRRFVWLMLEEMNIFSQTVVFGPGGHAASAFNEGKRMLGLRLLADVTRLAPNEYLQMTVENTKVELPETPDARSDYPDNTSE